MPEVSTLAACTESSQYPVVIFIPFTSDCLVHMYPLSSPKQEFLHLPAARLHSQCDNMGSRSPAEIML